MKRRVLEVLLSFLLLSFLIFFLSSSLDGDGSYALLGDDTDEGARLALMETLGLDKPLFVRYISFLFSFFTFSWGIGIDGLLVAEKIGNAIPKTLALASFSVIVAVPTALVVSFFAIRTRKGKLGFLFPFLFSLFSALPSFLFAIIIALSAISMGLYIPSFSYDGLLSYFIPSLTLGVLMGFQIGRSLFFSQKEELSSFYVKGMMSRGLSEGKIVVSSLKSSLIPVLPVFFEVIITLISGSAVMESLFTIPGIGSLMIEATIRRDVATLTTLMMLISFFIAIMYILLDLIEKKLDGRRRHEN